jgi:hypothetical protein
MEGDFAEGVKETPGSKERERIRAEERNRIGNMFLATVALIRARFLRFLGLLVKSDQSTKTQLTLAITEIYAFLIRRQKLNMTVRNSIRSLYPEFDPEKHFAKITYNKDHKETDRTPVPISSLPQDLKYAREAWFILDMHSQLVQGWVDTFDLYADEMYELTGTALIHMMEDFTRGPNNLAIDPATAERLTSELWE